MRKQTSLLKWPPFEWCTVGHKEIEKEALVALSFEPVRQHIVDWD